MRFSTTWVNSFTGYAVDLDGLGTVCRTRDALFVLNGSQALGARPIDLGAVPVDALTSCGYKWLCGPYGTGFCWIRADVREALEYNQVYWLALQAGRDLNQMRSYMLRDDLGARQYDVFCPANFLDTMPWSAAVQYLLDLGVQQVADHDQRLVSDLVEGLEELGFELGSPRAGRARFSLVLTQHRVRRRTEEMYHLLRDRCVNIALREDWLRFSPHLYNTEEDVHRALDVLGGA